MRIRTVMTSLSVLALAATAACGAAEEATPAAPSQSQSSPATAGGSAPTGQSAPAEEAAEEIVITISGFTFDVPSSVPPGATITVVNEDTPYHTVTSDDGVFDVGARKGEPTTFTAPEEPGEYPFHCAPHPDMTATLVVA